MLHRVDILLHRAACGKPFDATFSSGLFFLYFCSYWTANNFISTAMAQGFQICAQI